MVITLTDFATLSVGALSVILVVLAVIYIINNNQTKSEKFEEAQEAFAMAPDGVTVTSTGALQGPAIYTNSLTNGDSSQLLKQAQQGKLNDSSNATLGTTNNMKGFDGALQKQLKVQEIQNKSQGGFQQVEDLKEISKNIAQDNSLQGIFKRDGFATNKIYIDKYATVGIIDEKYMPNRDRPKRLNVVGNAILVPGFAFDATKSLTSNGTGICPTGGVPGVGLERHKKPKNGLHTLPKDGTQPAVKRDSLTGDAKQDKALEANGVIAASNISTVNQEPKTEDLPESQPTQVVPAVAKEQPAEQPVEVATAEAFYY